MDNYETFGLLPNCINWLLLLILKRMRIISRRTLSSGIFITFLFESSCWQPGTSWNRTISAACWEFLEETSNQDDRVRSWLNTYWFWVLQWPLLLRAAQWAKISSWARTQLENIGNFITAPTTMMTISTLAELT